MTSTMHAAMNAGRRILVVEDERAMRDMLVLALEREGFDVRALASGAGLDALLRGWPADLVLLDIGLPGIDGASLVPRIRAQSDAPIMMVTARSESEDRIRTLGAGADHYVTKPFELEVLLALIAAALRRPSLAERAVLVFGDVTLDTAARSVSRGSRALDLTPREFAVLEVLMRTPGRAFSKDEFLYHVWGVDYEGDGGVVDRFVSYLRAKLEACGEPRVIQTVRGVGYALRV
jgi:two-component system response regulator MprA